MFSGSTPVTNHVLVTTNSRTPRASRIASNKAEVTLTHLFCWYWRRYYQEVWWICCHLASYKKIQILQSCHHKLLVFCLSKTKVCKMGKLVRKRFKQTDCYSDFSDCYCDFVQLSVQDVFVGTNVILWLPTPLVGINLCLFFFRCPMWYCKL